MSSDLLARVFWTGLLLWSLTGCGPEATSSDESGTADSAKALTETYWLFAQVHDFAGNYKLTVNGFPVEQEPVNVLMSDQGIGARMNTALIREGNMASVVVEPHLQRSGDELDIGEAAFEAHVAREAEDGSYVPISELSKRRKGKGITKAEVDSAYQQWAKRARERWKKYLEWERQWLESNPDSSESLTSKEGGALDSIEAWSDRNPITVSTTFDNEAGPDFSRIFEKAPRLPDTPATRQRLKDYAMGLRDLMAAKDTSALFEEFRPAIEARYRFGTSRTRSEFMEANRQAVVVEGAVLDFTRSDLRVQQWVEGRVWQVWREEAINQGLFQDSSGGGLGTIYMAELEGGLKVVRY